MNIEERNKKVEQNLNLIRYSLKLLGYEHNEDYFQQGVLELIRCVECFDDTRNIEFSTYAVSNIKLKLKEYIIRDKVLKPKRTGVGGQVWAPECLEFDKPFEQEDGSVNNLYDLTPCENNFDEIDLRIEFELLIEKNIFTKEELKNYFDYIRKEKRDYEIMQELKISRKKFKKYIKNIKERLIEHLY